jgi:nucleoid DNA-binding protein
MKTKLFLLAALIFSTITFSQTSKKGYDYYKASSNSKMNKAELIDAIAKDAGNTTKRVSKTGRNPQTGKEIKVRKAISYGSTRSNKQTIKLNSNNTQKMNKGELIDAMAKGPNASANKNAPKKVAKFKAGKALAETVKNH